MPTGTYLLGGGSSDPGDYVRIQTAGTDRIVIDVAGVTTLSGTVKITGTATLSGANTLKLADGTATAPSLSFNSDASNAQSGVYKPTTSYLGISAGGIATAFHNDGGGVQGIRLRSDSQLGWSSSTSVTASDDTAFSRLAAASVGLGNGAQGDFTGTLKLTVLHVASGGSTTISTGVGSIKMSTANPATNTSWIPFTYAGTVYFVPGFTTNAP